jgi:hypothetical protein
MSTGGIRSNCEGFDLGVGAVPVMIAIKLIPDSTATPLVPSVTPSALGLDMTGRGGVSLDVHHARLLQQVLQKLEEKGRRDGEKAQAA